MAQTIYPVILCGGSGTRLWPLSRKSYPKQFARIFGDESLFERTLARTTGEGFGKPLIVTNAEFRFIVSEQLAHAGVDAAGVMIEPEGRNTAPAVIAAALQVARMDPDGMIAIVPSDHLVPDEAAFRSCIRAGLPAAEAGQIVTLGVTPDYPETGYGYLERAETGLTGPQPLLRFVEKPDADRAAEMVASGRFLWNAGLFLFSVATIVEAFRAHAPALLAGAEAALDQAQADLGFLRLAPEPWAGLEDISIDFAVMEKASNLTVVPFSAGWSDLGSWAAVHSETADAAGVATFGEATAIECTNTLLRSEDDEIEVVGIGLNGIIAVAMRDAVLVADMSRAQDVKLAVTTLKEKGVAQAQHFPKVHRPWGHYETLVLADRYQVKRIVVLPGQKLSLQSHVHRAEHWVVAAGTARVTVDESVQLLTENESIYIPLGAVHRLENPGKVELALIEVQSGVYLGEDDIIRYEDDYARA